MHTQTSIWRLQLLFRILIVDQLLSRSVLLIATLGLSSQHVLGIALSHDLAHTIDFTHALAKTLLQHIAKLLALYPTTSQLDCELGCWRSRLCAGFCVFLVRGRVAIPGGDGQGEHVALAMQTLDTSHGTKRKGEAIAGGTCTVGLALKGCRQRSA